MVTPAKFCARIALCENTFAAELLALPLCVYRSAVPRLQRSSRADIHRITLFCSMCREIPFARRPPPGAPRRTTRGLSGWSTSTGSGRGDADWQAGSGFRAVNDPPFFDEAGGSTRPGKFRRCHRPPLVWSHTMWGIYIACRSVISVDL